MDTPTQSQPQAQHRWHLPLPIAIFLLIIAILLIGALYGFRAFWAQRERADHYQAVFLTNGQVYFGKITHTSDNEITLESVYYLQSSENPQNDITKKDSSSNTNTADTQTQLAIVKLGSEIHGPMDKMYITKSNVLFTEDLKDSSQVVQAIQASK